jgi:hypothetical protein
MLTPRDVTLYPRLTAKKVAPTRIRPFTDEDVKNVHNEFLRDQSGTYFWDLEQRRQKVEIGRCLLVGVRPQDRWTSSEASVARERVAIGPADEAGFRRYLLKDPTPLTCFDIDHAFSLDNEDGKEPWTCDDASGAYVTWNGIMGQGSIMRVVQRAIFEQTYQRV